MQRSLPSKVVKIANDIKEMKIRGAGKIARAVAEALIEVAKCYKGESLEEFKRLFDEAIQVLGSTRPTAVSLFNALSYISKRVEATEGDLKDIKRCIIDAGEEFINYSLNAIRRIGEIGARIIRDGEILLTHCNSSAAVNIILRAKELGKHVEVFATETRPKFQGYITAKALRSSGIPVYLIPDSAVRYYIKEADKVIVGADTVAANGAVINKIGTSLIALIAKEANVDFLVAAETYKFSPATLLGEYVKIEERGGEEIAQGIRGVKIKNPAFDVTPPEYVDAIITEIGIIPPQAAVLVIREYGWPMANYDYKEVAVEEDEPIS